MNWCHEIQGVLFDMRIFFDWWLNIEQFLDIQKDFPSKLIIVVAKFSVSLLNIYLNGVRGTR